MVELEECKGAVDPAMRRSVIESLSLHEAELITYVDLVPRVPGQESMIEQQCHYMVKLSQKYFGDEDSKSAASDIQIELEDDRENWLICGKKRARVLLSVGSSLL